MSLSLSIRWLAFLSIAIIFFFFETALVYRCILLGSVFLIYLSVKCKIDIVIPIYLIFSFFYMIFLTLNSDGESLRVFSIVYPILCYALGAMLGKEVRDYRELLSVVYLFSFISASYYIISIAMDIYNNGFLGGGRSIVLLLSNDDYAKSATVIGGNFTALIAFLSLVFVSNRKLKYIITAFMIAYFSLRLGSRTQILLLLVALLVGYILSSKVLSVTKKFFYMLFSTSILIFLIYYIFEKSEYAFFFEDRMDSKTHGASSFGGRTDIWSESIGLMWSRPFGWTSLDMTTAPFAHNLWLDVYKNGGVVSFFIFLLFTLLICKKIISAYKKIDVIEIKVFIVTFCLVNFILFSMEPILDGFVFPFSMFLFAIAMIYSFSMSVHKKCT